MEGQINCPSARTIEVYQKHKEIAIKKYTFFHIAIISDLENEEVKERLADYENELKQLKTKMKDLARKSRKR